MSLWFRFLQRVQSSIGSVRLAPLGEGRIEMRTWPTDFDWTGHVGDERYLELMKLGRYLLATRIGIMAEMATKRVTAHVATTEVQYLDELGMFQSFELVSRIAGWDDKWLFVEHRVERSGKPIAIGRVQLVFKHAGETVPPDLVLSWTGTAVQSPPIPPEFESMRTNRPCRRPSQCCQLTEDDLPGLGCAAASEPI
jgi:acyl-CoA thioesterase FadM